MGNTNSEFSEISEPWWGNNMDDPHPFCKNKKTISTQTKEQSNPNKVVSHDVSRVKKKDHFDNQLSDFARRRREIIAEKKKEMDALREENLELKRLLEFERQKNAQISTREETQNLQEENIQLKDKVMQLEEELKTAIEMKDRYRELSISVAKLQKDLQNANSEIIAFEKERQEYNKHVLALKDIIAVSKQLLLMRETQIKELTEKIKEIESSLAKNEMKALAEDLRHEYERQLENIRQLRTLYEQRQNAVRTERDALKSQLDETKISLQNELEKNKELESRVEDLEKDNSVKEEQIVVLKADFAASKSECKELQAEMSAINQLFSQSLLGFNNGQEVDLDNLVKTLEENHDLLANIVIKEEGGTLPKVFLDLINQVNEKDKQTTTEEIPGPQRLETIEEEMIESQNSTPQNTLSTPTEIVQNLPKVWKVLTQLLSQQSGPINSIGEEGSDKNPCYKSVETPSGPRLVLSVSKTFIRLKDLILEKRLLEQEMGKLKRLNIHLETRLHNQEKRFETVSTELAKTWNVVGKMQKQHQQLHTQEKILRYELAQKRKLLTELKEELEYCREKWLQAREKNSTTEKQWLELRNEFASRKVTPIDENNSVESGYSDERESSSEDDQEEEIDILQEQEVDPEDHVTENEIVLTEEVITVISSAIGDNLEPAEAVTEEEILQDAHQFEEQIESSTLKTDLVQTPEDVQPSTSKTKDIVDTYKKLEEDILLAIQKTQNGEELENQEAETFNSNNETVEENLPITKPNLTLEERLAAREERLKRLEKQSSDLMERTKGRVDRSIQISNALDNLHEQYGRNNQQPSTSTSQEENSQES